MKITRRYFDELTGNQIRVKERNISDIEADGVDKISIEISVLNLFCSGHFLEAVLNWCLTLNRPVFFTIGDQLNRYNFENHALCTRDTQNADIELLVDRFRSYWDEKNQGIFNDRFAGIDLPIIEWNYWINSVGYKDIVKSIRLFLDENPCHQQALERDTQRIISNNKWNATGVLGDRIRRNIHGYMLEELAVYFIQNQNETVVHFYPGGQSFLLRSLQSDSKAPALFRKRKYVHYTFRGQGQNTYQDLGQWICNTLKDRV